MRVMCTLGEGTQQARHESLIATSEYVDSRGLYVRGDARLGMPISPAAGAKEVVPEDACVGAGGAMVVGVPRGCAAPGLGLGLAVGRCSLPRGGRDGGVLGLADCWVPSVSCRGLRLLGGGLGADCASGRRALSASWMR